MSQLELYHNGLSSCSQKVRLVLAEKNLAFASRDVNLVTGEQHAPVRRVRPLVTGAASLVSYRSSISALSSIDPPCH